MGIYQFITDLGFEFEPVFDSTLHRFQVGNRSDKSGWFIGNVVHDERLKADIKIMVVGDWSTNKKYIWHSKKRLNQIEKEVVDKERHQLEQKRKIKEQQNNEKAIDKVNFYLDMSVDSLDGFDYLENKNIDDLHGSSLCKTEDSSFLLIPLRDLNGKVWSAQRIFKDGSKKFISGGKVKGCFNLIGSLNSKIIYICEGFATGVSIHKATGYSVVCAMNTSNMMSVAHELRGKLAAKFIICADNDVATEQRIGSNPGVDAARTAASILSCSVIIPMFETQSHTDFNDMEMYYGLDEVKKVLGKTEERVDEKSKYPTKDDGFYFEFIDDDGKEKSMPDYDGLADYMMNESFLKCDDSLVYVWAGKHYKSISFFNLKHIINNKLKKGISPTAVNNFHGKALVKSFVNFNSLTEMTGILNCQNGLLNVSTGELAPHSPDNFVKYVLEHDYIAGADCPTFLKSLHLVTNGDQDLKELIQQVFGYCIAGGHPVAHKAFMFYGEGGNGKSTMLTALSNLVGQDNSSRVPLTLFDKPFSMISLDGKLVNLIDETPKFNINPEAFKNVVSGGYVRAAHKNRPEVDLKINARIVFACNKLPNFKDDSDGMMRRLVIIPFDHKIPDSEADHNIDNKIKIEMPGVLNWALEGLRILMANNYQFKKGKATVDAIDQYKVETDSVYYFFKQNIEFLNGPKGDEVFLKYSELYQEYKAFCIIEGMYSVSGRAFSRSASKLYAASYKKHGFEFTENDRQKYGKGKGVKRLRITSTYAGQLGRKGI